MVIYKAEYEYINVRKNFRGTDENKKRQAAESSMSKK